MVYHVCVSASVSHYTFLDQTAQMFHVCLIRLLNLYFIYFQKQGRVYKIGSRLIEIEQQVLDELAGLNAVGQKQDATLDNAFVKSVLTAVVPANEMQAGKINDAAIDFALGNLKEFLNPK